MQNSKNCSFTQFQAENGLRSDQNGEKMDQLPTGQQKNSNPNKQKSQNPLQIENIIVYSCDVIANYPQSQQHTQTISNEQSRIEKNQCEEEQNIVCNDCIDIESIMNSSPNPNHANIIIPYNMNSTIDAASKVAVSVPHKEAVVCQYKERDETKNIPKNYIKAIWSFILQNPILMKKILIKKRGQIQTSELNTFFDHVRSQKACRVYTIARLKEIWLNESYGKIMRIIYASFLRKRSLHYINSSKIENKGSHIKYRLKLLQALSNPNEFCSFK